LVNLFESNDDARTYEHHIWESFEINEVGGVDIRSLSYRMDEPRVMI